MPKRVSRGISQTSAPPVSAGVPDDEAQPLGRSRRGIESCVRVVTSGGCVAVPGGSRGGRLLFGRGGVGRGRRRVVIPGDVEGQDDHYGTSRQCGGAARAR